MSKVSKLSGAENFKAIISTVNALVDENQSLKESMVMTTKATEKFISEHGDVSEEQMTSYLTELYPEEVGE